MVKILEVQGLTKTYTMGVIKVEALKNVSFELYDGEFVVTDADSDGLKESVKVTNEKG